jgi:molybdopterin synthase catalytic subunit
MQSEVEVREADFGIDEEYARLRGEPGNAGACVLFTGLVREWADGAGTQALELEHYPGMTEASIAAIVRDARARWQLGRCVIHRVSRLAPGDQIVLVGVSSAHRTGVRGCEFIMDYLKTRAPIWKKK